MARDKLTYAIGNSSSTTSSSSITDSDTALPLTSDTNFAAKSGEGMVIIDEGQAAEELAYATTKSGSSLTIPLANRGLEGGSAQAHSSGASVKGILTAGMWNDLIDAVALLLDKTAGTIKSGIAFTSAILTTPVVRNWSGWQDANETWTYVSPTSYKVSGTDVSSKFPIGTRIKLTQTTVKYFVVCETTTFSTDTTVTVCGGSAYTLADAAITDNYFSYEESPQGYPYWFDYTPTLGAGGSMTYGTTTITTAKFSISGQIVFIELNFTGTTGGSAHTDITATAPFDMDSSSSRIAIGMADDGGTYLTGQAVYDASTDKFLFRKSTLANWGLGAGRAINGGFFCRIA